MLQPKNKILSATATDHEAITAVWEASVRATHHFLTEETIASLKPRVQHEFLKAVALYYVKDEAGTVAGFLGVSENKIEMLFVHPQVRAKGIGKDLLLYAIHQLGCSMVDVNEQNEQAVGFYKHMGFVVRGRSATDGLGMPYPILHMALQQVINR